MAHFAVVVYHLVSLACSKDKKRMEELVDRLSEI